MTWTNLVGVLAYFALLFLLAWPLGSYMARALEGKATWAGRVLGPVERALLRAAGVRPMEGAYPEMTWQAYARGVLVFSGLGVLFVYGLLRAQAVLPGNPGNLGAVTPEVSFNTAVSFVTNTNWQAYGGETTMSNLSQTLALTAQNFVSAAVGISVLLALTRGLTRANAEHVGNFWVDLVRSILYVLLPLAFVWAILLVSQGVVQTWGAAPTATLLDPVTGADGNTVSQQTLAMGPVASQIAIKQLGTNGGGFFNVNSAHPFENPTAISNLLEMLAILLLPAALCVTFGKMLDAAPPIGKGANVKPADVRHGIALLAAMVILLLPAIVLTVWAESQPNPALVSLGADPSIGAGNMEGKEVRFGIAESALWANATTAASNGSVNAMHDSFMPLGSLGPMVLMLIGEVAFGGVGSGLYGMLAYAIVAVFIAGLMIGRTPEYLGKKIEAFEIKMAAVALLLPAVSVLIGAAIACVAPGGTAPLGNPGIHGFSEILYAFASGANNNGSAFAGLTASGPFYAIAIGIVMWIGRFGVIVPVLALAGSLAKKKIVPPSPGTLPTHTPLFVGLLVGTVLLFGALTFIPALALGPVVEHLALPR